MPTYTGHRVDGDGPDGRELLKLGPAAVVQKSTDGAGALLETLDVSLPPPRRRLMAGEPILVVDDSPQNLKLTRVLLAAEGYEVRTAIDAEEALRVLAVFRPRAILDIQLPGMDGLELTRRLKADPMRRQILVVALTAYAMKGDEAKAMAAGCDYYLSKPIDTDALPVILREQLARKNQDAVPYVNPNRSGLEDNPLTRKMLRVTLEMEGYSVIEAKDGRTALAAATAEMPDLVLQDLILPDMNGFELVRMLRALPGGADAPILALSGFLSRIEEARTARAGFTALLVKPVEPSRLVDIVRVYFPTSRHSEPPLPLGRRILLVDDDPVQLKLTKIHLEQLGYEVAAVSSAMDALRAARAFPPDLRTGRCAHAGARRLSALF